MTSWLLTLTSVLLLVCGHPTSPQSLTSAGWSQSPVTDEDRRRLLGTFVTNNEVETVLPQQPIDHDPVLGEVLRQPPSDDDGERIVRQSSDNGDSSKVLKGFFVNNPPEPEAQDNFNTNFVDDTPEVNYEEEYNSDQSVNFDYHEYHQDLASQEQQTIQDTRPPPPPPQSPLHVRHQAPHRQFQRKSKKFSRFPVNCS